MPNIYLILSILQFICLPNRSSNKNLPSLSSSTLFPLPGWVTFGRAYRLRLVGKIFNFLPELSDWKRERRGRERVKRKSEPNKLAWRIQNQSLQSAGGNVDTRWQLELMLKLRLELLAGLLVSSQISTKIWLSIIDGGNNGNVECSGLLAANEARLASLPLLPLLFSPFPTPRRGFYLKTILFALWICGA